MQVSKKILNLEHTHSDKIIYLAIVTYNNSEKNHTN